MKRILFWAVFVVFLGLIVWGLVLASNRSSNRGVSNVSSPAPISSEDHIFGPDNASVTIIEYSDFECPACQAYYYFISKLISESSTTVRLVYRHFPLPQHVNAMLAAEASEAAALQGKFFEMYDNLFKNQSEWANLADPSGIFEQYASTIGLNVNRFKADIKSVELKNKVEGMFKEGRNIGIDATPTFFLNGKVIANPNNYEQFKTAIETAASSNIQ